MILPMMSPVSVNRDALTGIKMSAIAAMSPATNPAKMVPFGIPRSANAVATAVRRQSIAHTATNGIVFASLVSRRMMWIVPAGIRRPALATPIARGIRNV